LRSCRAFPRAIERSPFPGLIQEFFGAEGRLSVGAQSLHSFESGARGEPGAWHPKSTLGPVAFFLEQLLRVRSLETLLPFVEEEMVLGELGGPRRRVRLRYRRFAEEGLARGVQNPLEPCAGKLSWVMKVLFSKCSPVLVFKIEALTDPLTTTVTL